MAEKITSTEELLQKAKDVFKEEFQIEPEVAACAPGRVNLIGEHIDYNEGYVLPMALPMITIIVGTKIPGEQSIVITDSEDIDKPHKITIDMPNKCTLIVGCRPGKPKWANYIKGVIANYIGETSAFLACIVSSVPVGAGLSSSAALEVACYTFLDALNPDNQMNVLPTDKALACQKAEQDYAGMPCGIMDQFVSMLGKKNNALLIDCRSLSSTLVPFDDSQIVILITDSNVKHELTGSEYSTRRKQCQQAALHLNKISLRDATQKDLLYLKDCNVPEEVYKRAKHVISEIERTIAASNALKAKNFAELGELMKSSHESLKSDFEVSCAEIDELVAIANGCEGVLGSRMTGGGFGGCTVTLVSKNHVEKVMETICKLYNLGPKPKFYICSPNDGSKILKI